MRGEMSGNFIPYLHVIQMLTLRHDDFAGRRTLKGKFLAECPVLSLAKLFFQFSAFDIILSGEVFGGRRQ